MGMSVSAAGKKGGRRRRGVPRYGAMAEINMTPFIDVMLVLLIIFMVAAPLLTSGVPIDLPKADAGALNVDQHPLSISVDERGNIFVADQPVAVEDLVTKVQDLAKQGFDERIYLRGAKDVNYGRIADVMSRLTTAGYRKVALVTEQGQK